MPQFEFLVMTEKNIFAYKLFLSLNISDFNLFFMWKLHSLPSPTEKSHPSFSATPFKSWGPIKPPFLKIWFEAQLPPPPLSSKKGGVHTIGDHPVSCPLEKTDWCFLFVVNLCGIFFECSIFSGSQIWMLTQWPWDLDTKTPFSVLVPYSKQSSILKFQDKLCLGNILTVSKSVNNMTLPVINT